MAGRSPIAADEEQRQWLMALSHSRDRGEADRARAILLTLSGWTSREIAEAFVREDTVRFWRGAHPRCLCETHPFQRANKRAGSPARPVTPQGTPPAGHSCPPLRLQNIKNDQHYPGGM